MEHRRRQKTKPPSRTGSTLTIEPLDGTLTPGSKVRLGGVGVKGWDGATVTVHENGRRFVFVGPGGAKLVVNKPPTVSCACSGLTKLPDHWCPRCGGWTGLAS